ncbi:protein takeout-like [Drosophila albomicans]|uniref:Protein takeout-like n=1 Tax=Drosophila albomicans TaxID=7291 RepID=A0A9C6TAW3_DROAB|nr:protein takeout-like [Drosophila albomicans]
MKAHLLEILILLIGFTYIHAGNFLTEKPDVLESCSFDGPKLKECLISNLQVIFINWTHGLPGSNIIGPVDPFTIKRLILSRSSPSDDSNPVNVDTDVRNVLVSGVSQAKIVDASYLPKNNKTEVLLWIPKINIDFDYSVKGNVGGRKLDDHSKGHVKIEKLLIAFDVDIASLVTPKGNFIDVQHVSVSFREIGKLKFKVNKLFGGDKYLEKLTHDFINENWVEFYISWRPIIEYVIETMVFLRSRKIFSYIPAEYLIDNYALLESL